MEFGRNGAILSTDERTEREFRETRKNDFDLCVLSVVQLIAHTGVVAYFSFRSRALLDEPLLQALIVAAFAVAVAPSLFAFAQRAVDYERLPVRFGSIPKYRHVSGFGLFAMVAVAAAVAGLAAFASYKLSLNEAFEIPKSWGDGILLAVIAAFLLAIIGRLFTNTPFGQSFSQVADGTVRRFSGIGRAASVVDSWLVFVVAPMAGVTQRSAQRRTSELPSSASRPRARISRSATKRRLSGLFKPGGRWSKAQTRKRALCIGSRASSARCSRQMFFGCTT
jgi:hypothetical protein